VHSMPQKLNGHHETGWARADDQHFGSALRNRLSAHFGDLHLKKIRFDHVLPL